MNENRLLQYLATGRVQERHSWSENPRMISLGTSYIRHVCIHVCALLSHLCRTPVHTSWHKVRRTSRGGGGHKDRRRINAGVSFPFLSFLFFSILFLHLSPCVVLASICTARRGSTVAVRRQTVEQNFELCLFITSDEYMSVYSCTAAVQQ